MDGRPYYPPIDICQMAVELGVANKKHARFMEFIIENVKLADKVMAPYSYLATLPPIITEGWTISDPCPVDERVPAKTTLLSVTVDQADQHDIVNALWIPADSTAGRMVNRLFSKPDIKTDRDFHWVLLFVQTGENFVFGRYALCVPHTVTDTIMVMAPFKEMNESEEAVIEKSRIEQACVPSLMAMRAVLYQRKNPDPKGSQIVINCGTEPEFARIQNAFGAITESTWDMTVFLENEDGD